MASQTRSAHGPLAAQNAVAPSQGRVVGQPFDALGRLTQISSGAANYVSNVTYNAAAQPTGFLYGNGAQAAFSYNAQMQLQSLAYSNSTGTIFSLTYGYGTADNGQIQSITDGYDSGRTANYTYDAWARQKTAQTNGSADYSAWGLSFSYDRYGNRTQQSVTIGSAPANSLTFSNTGGALTNHADNYSYDLSGDLINDGQNSLTYDAEGRVLSSSGSLGSASYTYDGNGLRIEKSGSNGTTIYLFSGTKVIGEYASGAQASSPTTEYIYADAELVASISSGTTVYYHPDQLSVRAITNSAGSLIGQQGHYPFGESWYANNTTTKWLFTSYERDPESANDYAIARSYINRFARFESPDPLGNSQADTTNPQSWNTYAYVLNNPLAFIDPTGMNCVWDDGSYDASDDPSDNTKGACELLGGTWFDNITGDWNPNPNPYLQQLIQLLNSGCSSPGVLCSETDAPYPTDDQAPTPQVQVAANNGTPQQPTKTQERLERLKNCALGYYGIDPLSISGATSNGAKWGLIALSAGGIPKSVASSLGLRVIMQPGASEYTSALSMLSLATGGGGALRTIANFGSKWAGPIAIASAVIDATAIGICTASD